MCVCSCFCFAGGETPPLRNKEGEKKVAEKKKTLTEKQKQFCIEYLVDFNATHAAIRAGYSVESAADIGSENMTKPHILAEIEKLRAEISAKTGVTPERVLNELAKIAFASPCDVIDFETGEILDKDSASAIASVKIKETPNRDGDIIVERDIRFADRIKALELCGKHVGLFKDRVELSGEGGTIKVQLEGDVEDWAH